MNEANTSDFNCLAYKPTNRLTEINAYISCALFNLENCLQDQLPEVAVCNRWLCGCGSLRTGTAHVQLFNSWTVYVQLSDDFTVYVQLSNDWTVDVQLSVGWTVHIQLSDGWTVYNQLFNGCPND